MHESKIILSKHLCEERWPERGDESENLIDVWKRGADLDVYALPFSGKDVPEHDEARFDKKTQTVIFRRGRVLVTVYNVTPEYVTNKEGKAVRSAVLKQFGPGALK